MEELENINTISEQEKQVQEEPPKYSLLGIEMPFAEFDRLLCEQAQGKELKVINGQVVAEYHVPTQEEILENKRAQREPLLTAFDKWEKAVLRGREQDDYSVMLWYQDLLNLQDTAFTVIPERIKYYL